MESSLSEMPAADNRSGLHRTFHVGNKGGHRNILRAARRGAEKAEALYAAYTYDLSLFQRTTGTIYVSLDGATHYLRNAG